VRHSEVLVLIPICAVVSLRIHMILQVEKAQSDDELEPVILVMLISFRVKLDSLICPQLFVQIPRLFKV
jgi:hypothetical protein